MNNTETYGSTRHMTNKRERKLKEQSRMANPEILTTRSHKTHGEYQQHPINVREN